MHDRSAPAWALAALLLALVTFDRVTARWEGHSGSFVLDGREPGVLLVVIEVTHPPLADGYVSGFSEKLPRPIQDVQFGETRGTLARAQDGGATMIGKSAPCAVAVVLGVSPEITKEIARDIPAAAEPTLEEG